MKYVSAFLLARLGGNDEPTAKDIGKILESVGIDVDKERLDKVVSELSGKDVDELIKNGLTKLASVPSGGAAVAGGGSGPAAGNVDEEAEKKEEKAEKEEEEESDEDMGFGLFD